MNGVQNRIIDGIIVPEPMVQDFLKTYNPPLADVEKPYSVYLAGPMTNRPQFNFPLFFDAAKVLRELGWKVLSPAEKDLEQIPWERMVTIPGFDTGNLQEYMKNCEFTMENAMEWDLPAIQRANGIVLLPEWETSTGARYERVVAEALGRDIWLYNNGLPIKDQFPTRMTDYLKWFAK